MEKSLLDVLKENFSHDVDGARFLDDGLLFTLYSAASGLKAWQSDTYDLNNGGSLDSAQNLIMDNGYGFKLSSIVDLERPFRTGLVFSDGAVLTIQRLQTVEIQQVDGKKERISNLLANFIRANLDSILEAIADDEVLSAEVERIVEKNKFSVVVEN